MVVLLILIAFLAVGFGLLALSQATMGVGAICFACFCGILARIAQAGDQHRALLKSLPKPENATSSAERASEN